MKEKSIELLILEFLNNYVTSEDAFNEFFTSNEHHREVKPKRLLSICFNILNNILCDLYKDTYKLNKRNKSKFFLNAVKLIFLLKNKPNIALTDEDAKKLNLRTKDLLSTIKILNIYNIHYEKAIVILESLEFSKSPLNHGLGSIIKALIDRKSNPLFIEEICEIYSDTSKVRDENNSFLFDYAFNKAIDAIKHNDNSYIVEYVYILKLLYHKDIDSKKYRTIIDKRFPLHHDSMHLNEIYNLILGDLISLSSEEVKTKYGLGLEHEGEFTKNFTGIKCRKDNFIMTIDPGEGVKDDALSVERDGDNFIMTISISDVAEFIERGSDLDINMLKHYKNIYHCFNSFPILEPSKATKLSLDEGTPRRVLSLKAVFDSCGTLLDYSFLEEEIIVNVNLSYSQAEKVLREGKGTIVYENLSILNSLCIALAHQSRAKDLYRMEKLETKSLEEIAAYASPSHSLVQEPMILYNSLSSQFMKDEIFFHRILEEEFLEKIITEENLNFDEKRLKQLTRIFQNPEYSLVPKGHSGIKKTYYSHSTSPLRRYCDKINQHKIKNKLRGLHDDDIDEAKEIVEYMNYRDVILEMAVKEYIATRKLEKKRRY